MSVYTRCFLASSLVLGLAACAGGSQGPTPAAGTGSAPEVTGGRVVFQKMRIAPAAGAPALMMNFVASGPPQGGVPCIGCVSGATTGDNIGLTGPSGYVLSGTYWQYTISFTDVSYTGKCKVSWKIAAGKKTIDSFSASFNLTTAGGFVVYALNRSRPKYSGPAKLTGKYVCGSNSASTTEPLYFQ